MASEIDEIALAVQEDVMRKAYEQGRKDAFEEIYNQAPELTHKSCSCKFFWNWFFNTKEGIEIKSNINKIINMHKKKHTGTEEKED